MDLKTGQDEFTNLLQRLNSSETLHQFLGWVKENWFPSNLAVEEGEESAVLINGQEAEELLEKIATDLRQNIPVEAQLPSENLISPTTGPLAGCQIVNVDGFLYDEELAETLHEEGKLPKALCLTCGSRSTKPLSVVSHSASREELSNAFLHILPDLSGKHLIDIGSRFGAVLFGAFAYSQAARITGIEVNPDWASISASLVTKYNMQSRVEIICGDLRCHPELIASADVIVMNNVFDLFLPAEIQRDIWLNLRHLFKPGALLLTNPCIEKTLSQLNIQINGWLEKLPNNNNDQSLDMDLTQLFRVITNH